MLRQHGARDHTCPWFYGPETEKIIEDIIKLRHAMKPYYTAELNKLNETGRPFNRALMWDFPVRRNSNLSRSILSWYSSVGCQRALATKTKN